MSGSWPSVVRRLGGVHEIGKLTVCIVDSGVIVAWNAIVKWEWRTPAWRRMSRRRDVEMAARSRL